MGYLIILAAGLSWLMLVHPEWLTNHWAHWLFPFWIDD